MKRAVLLVNLGTPDGPDRTSVRRYLGEFLNDPYVIDLPWLLRKVLVNGIIIPFRVRKSTRLYERVWTPQGSPILEHLNALQQKVQERLAGEVKVYAAMRYRKPSLVEALRQINADGCDELLVFPLFPQFAVSTTETIFNQVRLYQSELESIKNITFVRDFYNDPGFIASFASRLKEAYPERYDHILFSYHSLPVRHLEREHPGRKCAGCSCEQLFPAYGGTCYKAMAYETSRLIAAAVGLPADRYTVSFQSRFARRWIGPFTEEEVERQAKRGSKRILVLAPSFVADCLETIVEIGMDYEELFRSKGGEALLMLPSLNADESWADALVAMIRKKQKQ